MASSAAGITDAEIVAQLRVIMFGAIETIQASIMNTLAGSARLPGLRLTGHEPPSGFAFRRPAVMHLTWSN